MKRTVSVFRVARVMRGLNQTELGKRVGKSQSWVSRYESGEIQPRGKTKDALSRILAERVA